MHATLAQLLPAIQGATLTADAAFDGVSTDSRSIAPGSLFVALRGEQFDAHAFLGQAAAKGALAVVVERLPADCALPALVVPDTLVALGRIANQWRRRFALPLAGVTGSNGKTTVKEMIAAILAAAHGDEQRLATRGNLNNEVGVPLTLMRLDAGHRAAVVELGMNHPGEIARLAAMAEPSVGLVNNAQREHQEFMHSVEAVALENGSVIGALGPDGVAVFPHADPYTPLWRQLAGARRTTTFGLDDGADVHCSWQAENFGSTLQVSAHGTRMTVRLAAAGEHNVRNALAAIAVTQAMGVDSEAIVRGLEAFAPVNGRLQRKAAPGGVTVIDDSYNANPDSVRAAIDVLAQAAAPRVLVLGDMGEVGSQGPQFHQEIAAYAHEKGIVDVFALGELARHLCGFGARHFEQLPDLLTALDARLAGATGSTVLVKGSRFMKMERVVQHLLGTQDNNKEAH